MEKMNKELTKDECGLCLDEFDFRSERPLPYEYGVLKRLIDEHFNNPALKFEELIEMKGKAAWDNYLDEWNIVLGRHPKAEEIKIYSASNGEYYKNYKSDRFYLKEVKADG